jgi:hypothetical protein
MYYLVALRGLKITLIDKDLNYVIFYLQLPSYTYYNTKHSFLSYRYEDSNSSIIYTWMGTSEKKGHR